ncbi:hypothetical protein PV10_01083 [Exophiala mesophila]|uniref:Zn(2)-C6 fungal-type domain-containing protein n=1 Tax=Exophiala mesophila TaxID=212818 RepID=A0A0D1Y9F6_EXOME|nr:uncharacterized protein PV10_01083 [Exophiala mesophila]KIV97321.1 hypothetical protein PV10_01083 [Exophiala mesophila]
MSNVDSTSATFLPPPRQIRFVSTDGQPYTKRRRINSACLTCRKRKTRCSGERPECKTCTDNSHVCSGYAERSSRRDNEKGEDDLEEEESPGPPTPPRQPSHEFNSTNPMQLAVENPVPATSSPTARRGDGDERQGIKSPAKSPGSNYSTGSARNFRVPYFRYFGPTAIVPGFKQMVVQLKDHRRSLASPTDDSPASGLPYENNSALDRDRGPVEISFYDATDPGPNSPLVTHLCETFFTHLGCNYPFLQRERFLKDLEEKCVDAILVDAVCAVAARFSSDPTLCKSNDSSTPLDRDQNVKRAFRGAPFAHRAMSAVIDTFSCPTIAVAQACTLLAYDEFGTDHDSGLWMYLGTAIRMAQDLGIQKLEGMQVEGRIGPTPKTAKNGAEGKAEESRRAEQQRKLSLITTDDDGVTLEDRKASERERIDTFWTIFFLDRAVSSGVGRPVTLRDKDIEISFPYRPDNTAISGYPDPFPEMIKIVHMYGRVADVINNIKEVTQVTPGVLKRLASMEKDLTGIYQRLSPKLHFNATNYQHYVKAGHGTNFILLHFWFHTLIMLVHQPTLLHSFEGRIQQLFPDSRELSMSSAKTIADILAFAELIDVNSFIGNPFTSQPMYVAACAFLAEAALHTSQPSSRATSPPGNGNDAHVKQKQLSENARSEQRAASARHTLLATAANQNYQRCYKALKTLDSYWAGCRYILTALDQKAKGLMDPILFTAEDLDGEMPSTEPSFTTPGWRRGTSLAASMGAYGPSPNRFPAFKSFEEGVSFSPKMDLSQAIGWSLTGTANSPAPNLSVLYPNSGVDGVEKATNEFASNHRRQFRVDSTRLPSQDSVPTQGHIAAPMDALAYQQAMPQRRRMSSLPYDPVSTAEADLLLGLHSPYGTSSSHPSVVMPPGNSQVQAGTGFDYSTPQSVPQPGHVQQQQQNLFQFNDHDFDSMFVETQDINMGDQNLNLNFSGGDMIPWLEYLPQDVLNYFGEPQHGEGDRGLSGGVHPAG